MLANVRGTTAQKCSCCRQLSLLLWFGAAQCCITLKLHLIFQEYFVGSVDQPLHAHCLAQRRDRIILGEQGVNHHGFNHQLTILGLRYGIQDRFHLQREFQLPRCHLLSQILRQEPALDDQAGASFKKHPDSRVESTRYSVKGSI